MYRVAVPHWTLLCTKSAAPQMHIRMINSSDARLYVPRVRDRVTWHCHVSFSQKIMSMSRCRLLTRSRLALPSQSPQCLAQCFLGQDRQFGVGRHELPLVVAAHRRRHPVAHEGGKLRGREAKECPKVSDEGYRPFLSLSLIHMQTYSLAHGLHLGLCRTISLAISHLLLPSGQGSDF